jgi:hypothetical protein
MLAVSGQRSHARRHFGERLAGFAGQRLAEDFPMLRFGGAVVTRGAHLETAHQFVVDVADDEAFSHMEEIAKIAGSSIAKAAPRLRNLANLNYQARHDAALLASVACA